MPITHQIFPIPPHVSIRKDFCEPHGNSPSRIRVFVHDLGVRYYGDLAFARTVKGPRTPANSVSRQKVFHREEEQYPQKTEEVERCQQTTGRWERASKWEHRLVSRIHFLSEKSEKSAASRKSAWRVRSVKLVCAPPSFRISGKLPRNTDLRIFNR